MIGPMKAKISRKERSLQEMSKSRLIAGPKPVRYSSIMCTSRAATVSKNSGRMIAGSSGLEIGLAPEHQGDEAGAADDDHRRQADLPVTIHHRHHDEADGGDQAEDLSSLAVFHAAASGGMLAALHCSPDAGAER